MDKAFDFDKAQIIADKSIDNVCIRSFFIDLFKGNDSNPAIITPLEHAESFDNLTQIKAFLPEVIKNSIEEKDFQSDYYKNKCYSYIILASGYNKTPINLIKKYYEKDYDNLICDIEASLEKYLFSKSNANINFEALKIYLRAASSIFTVEGSLPSKIYSLLLDNRDYKKVLAHIFATYVYLMDTSQVRNSGKWNYTPPTDVKKAGVLNEIWLLDKYKDADFIRLHIVNNYNLKKYNEAFGLLDDLYKSKAPLLQNDFELQYIYLEILLNGWNEKGKKEIAQAVKIINSHYYDNPEAKFLLYKFYNGDYYSGNKDEDKAEAYYQIALETGSYHAILHECSKLETSDMCKTNEIIELMKKLDYNSMNQLAKGKYHYYNGLVLVQQGKSDDADAEFDKAIQNGFAYARSKKQKKHRQTNEVIQNFSINSRNAVVVNSNQGKAEVFLKSIPESYSVYSIRDIPLNKQFNNICETSTIFDCFNTMNIDNTLTKRDRIVFALFGENKSDNLNDCLEILDRLYNHALDIKNHKNKKRFIDKIDIYVNAEYQFASTFLDASLSDMGDDIYFRVHIVDENRASAHMLLWEYPLFNVFFKKDDSDKNLQKRNNYNQNAIIFGASNLTKELHKEMLAAAYLGEEYKFAIYNFCNYEDADLIQEQLELDMPGIYDKVKESIVPMNLRGNEVFKGIASNSEKLCNSNYIVVDVGTDEDNIKFAINLRRAFTKKMSENNKPLIYVYCKEPKTAYLAMRMTISNSKQSDVWYNNYDLQFFGMDDTVFSYESLLNNELDRIAKQIHIQYSGSSSHSVQNDYYSFQYNQDSSISAAIAIRYRLFVLGCYSNKLQNTSFSIAEDKNLLKKYKGVIETDIEKYARIENERWCNFMYTRGWTKPSYEQLKWYLNEIGITNHKYLLPLMHPYIDTWDNLDEDGDMFKIVIDFYSKFDKTPSSPKDITKEGVIKAFDALEAVKEPIREFSVTYIER